MAPVGLVLLERRGRNLIVNSLKDVVKEIVEERGICRAQRIRADVVAKSGEETLGARSGRELVWRCGDDGRDAARWRLFLARVKLTSASFSTRPESCVTTARLTYSRSRGRTFARSVKSGSGCKTLLKRNWMITRSDVGPRALEILLL